MLCSEIRAALDGAIAEGEIVGAVAVVTDAQETLSTVTAGYEDLEREIPMKEDALFCIASMTKPITGIAAMMMMEEGNLSLDDSLAKHLPAFLELKDSSGVAVTVTLRQCLSHTSGMSDLSLEEEDDCMRLSELVPLIVSKPVNFPPGTEWRYCQTSINMVGHVLEVLSGMDFPTFVSTRIFDPLGMKDTTFYPDASQIPRIASIYGRMEGGGWERTSHDWVTHGRLETSERYPKANGGLFSTAEDYARFCRSLLKQGSGLVSPESVREFSSVQTGELETGFTPGNGWGLGCAITKQPQGVTAPFSPGTFGHGGLYGTQGWIDPIERRAYILMVQRSDFENADGSKVREEFQRAAAKSGREQRG
jgi:CubicO group peptidase (beta-lactamase class C family)